MAHAYSAGGSRRSAVFTAIIGLHFAIFLLVINDQMPVNEAKATSPPPFRVLPPKLPPRRLAAPDLPDPIRFGDVVVPVPELDIPTLEAPATAPGPRTDSGDHLVPREAIMRTAASLQGPASDFAVVIRACYPAGARRSGEEGRLRVAVLIGDQGQVRSWRVVQSTGYPRLDAAAPCVLGRLGFNAAREDGLAVQSEVLLPIIFRLD